MHIMAIDLKSLDSSIEELETRKRKLEKLRALLNDEETRDLISDPEIMNMIQTPPPIDFALNGKHPSEETDGLPAEGSLRRAVLDAARAWPGKFSGKDIQTKLEENNFEFATKKPELSIHGVLVYLDKKKLVTLARKGSGRQPHLWEAVREGARKK
jgi:hypothetical protein